LSQSSKSVIKISKDQLYELIAQRLLPDANKVEIDQRILELFGKKWCLMMTDLAGFSHRVAEYGITHVLQTIYAFDCLLILVTEQHKSLLLKTDGDSFLVNS
jgi:adenylate cyclase